MPNAPARTPEARPARPQDVTFRMMHDAIEEVRRVVGKYHALLTLKSIVEWEPAAQFDTLAPYREVWAPNMDRLRDALRNEDERGR